MSTSVCPLHDEYGSHLRWEFTTPLGTCVYNIFDEFAFIIGWLSVASWTFALLPQIITNCKNKAAESQSFYFWLLWLVGDFCNFAGCILTKNLITNIALALVYLSLTIFACIQFVWYEYIVKKYKHDKVKRQYLLQHQHQTDIHNINIPLNANKPKITDSVQVSMQSKQDEKRRRKKRKKRKKRKMDRNGESEAVIWSTPKFAMQYQKSVPTTSMSPKLQNTLKILSRSPRMFSVTPQLTNRMRREYEQLQGMNTLNVLIYLCTNVSSNVRYIDIIYILSHKFDA